MKTTAMSYAAIDVTSRNIDWSECDFFESGERKVPATFLDAVECYACQKTTVRGPGESECPKCHAEGDPSEGPMMNYWYPLGDGCDELTDEQARKAAFKIRRLPLCVVKVGEEWGLALTGGGMSLSWEICEAFMRLGLLPPVQFTPAAMCGRGTSKRDRWIVRGYVRACRGAASRANRSVERAREALAFGERYEAERAVPKPTAPESQS